MTLMSKRYCNSIAHCTRRKQSDGNFRHLIVTTLITHLNVRRYMKPSKRSLVLTALVALLTLPLPSLSQDLLRGIKNYQDILSGRKKFEQLSQPEQQEVIVVHKRIQARSNTGKSADCRDAMSRAETSASELADYAKRLQQCADSQDYSDDCSTEYRRTRSAHSDYESAVSSVGSYCR